MTGYILADPVSGSPSFDAAHFRMLLGVLGHADGARRLGALQGIHPAGSATLVTASSSTWTVAAHRGLLDEETSATAGGYPYLFDADVTGSVTPADATHDRIDLLSVRLDDPSQGDGSSVPLPVIVYTNGTAAASPTAPTTPARCMAFAQVRVPVSGGGSPVVTMVAPIFAAVGGILPVSGSGQYPANPYRGMVIDDAAADAVLRHNGTRFGAVAMPRAKAIRTTNFAVTTSVFTGMTGWSSTIARGGLTVASGGITVLVDGDYWIATNATYSQNPTSDRGVLLTVNGSEPAHPERGNVGAAQASRTSVGLTTSKTLSAGDVVNIELFQNSGGSLNVEFASLDVLQIS